jgi:hypothetical protein
MSKTPISGVNPSGEKLMFSPGLDFAGMARLEQGSFPFKS